MLKIIFHGLAVVGIYLVFSFAIYLGLHVRPLYGNLGLLVVAVVVAAYERLRVDRLLWLGVRRLSCRICAIWSDRERRECLHEYR